MTIDEAIQHAEKVAKRYEYLVESDNEGHGFYGTNENCVKCAKEHRQLAEWLKELQRARILLKAAYNLLEQQVNSGYVLNLLAQTVFYDEAECDGNCLMEDIGLLLELETFE